ncbi:MAG: hypothetical protein LKI92_13195, partial [Schleiferilactobacillus harbinensis]|nr:hypothetical protein [Schleiferilactobacillus harbinensis]
MKKGLLISLTVAAALGTSGLAIGTTTNVFSSPAVVQAATIGNVYVFGDQADVYNTPNGTIVRTLPTGSGWQYSATQTDSSDTHWYQVAPSQWINDKQAVTAINPGSIRNETGVVVVQAESASIWTTPNMHKSGRTLPYSSTWKYSRTFTDTFGMTWYRVSTTEWVHTSEVGKLGPSRAMVATAYDPKVTGSTLPYDTVAANLGVFPRGTRLLVTFKDGTSKIYTVRDTGEFAASHPNQLDLAMPNAEALQFGKQNITV